MPTTGSPVLRNVLLKTLWDRRRGLIGWAVGLAAFAGYGLALYPTIRRSAAELNRLVENLPAPIRALSGEAGNFGTAQAYLNSQFFNLMLPLLLLVFAIGFGARTVAGEEQDGTLELLLASPLPRWRVVAEKFAALVLGAALLGVVLLAVLLIGGRLVGMDVGLGDLASTVLRAVLLAVAFGAMAVAVGCATGRRSVAVGATATAAAAAYLVNASATFADWLETARAASPFYHYGSPTPLGNGLAPGHVAFLVMLAVVFLVLALLAFDRRDIAS